MTTGGVASYLGNINFKDADRRSLVFTSGYLSAVMLRLPGKMNVWGGDRGRVWRGDSDESGGLGLGGTISRKHMSNATTTGDSGRRKALVVYTWPIITNQMKIRQLDTNRWQ